jgi:hypothetical protein
MKLKLALKSRRLGLLLAPRSPPLHSDLGSPGRWFLCLKLPAARITCAEQLLYHLTPHDVLIHARGGRQTRCST